MRRIVLVCLALAALLAAGCGGSSTVETSEAPAPAETAAPGGGAQAPATGDAQVGMKGLKFEPAAITVQVGEKITWTNDEDIPHNVVAEEGADFSSETFGKDGTFAFSPKQAGTIAYVCTLHPGMDGTITVEG